jgi:hypothetical protein
VAVAVAAVAAAAVKGKKKRGGLLCRVVGLVGVCCRGCVVEDICHCLF